MSPRNTKRKIPGSVIVKARTKHGLTQEQLAELWNMERTHLSRIENSESIINAWVLLAAVLSKYGAKGFAE